jgi:hypothetical protein
MITHRLPRYDSGQTQPRVEAAARVAAQKRTEMASWSPSACGHDPQAPGAAAGREVGTVGLEAVMTKPD